MNLAYRLRPKTFNEFIGQKHLLGQGQLLKQILKSGQLVSMIFWGPPGSGKTTLAELVAKESGADFHRLSGVTSGKKDLMELVEIARVNQQQGKQTIIFIDEIHRWNKAQQDTLLPYVETGLVTLIGATTENPTFEIISPLMSRSKLLIFEAHSTKDLEKILEQALNNPESGIAKSGRSIAPDARELLIKLSGGDARIVLNGLELAFTTFKDNVISKEIIKKVFQDRTTGLYDKQADEHYHTISAFIKSMRGSDPNASLYYLVRMLESGEDPKFIARRMIIFASEDIGLADRGALIQAVGAFDAVHRIGLPEAKLILAHVVLYLARAKKSRAVANALGAATKVVYDYPNETVPLHLRNPSTKLKKKLGYGKSYEWSEKHVGPTVDLPFLPEKLKDRVFYED